MIFRIFLYLSVSIFLPPPAGSMALASPSAKPASLYTQDPGSPQTPSSGGGIVVLGDSISAAYGIDKSLGWVALLAKRLQHTCSGLTVHNASVSGETTAGGLIRLADLLTRLKPALVIIELGGNDGLRGLSPEQMQSNFQAMIRLVRDAKAEPVLLGILIPPNYGRTYRQLFEQAIASAAIIEQVPLLDFFLAGVADRPALMQDDGLHPTAEAQPILLANAWQIMEAPLQRICPGLGTLPDGKLSNL
jgi:acyl-CoA thioesterase I